MITQDFYGQIQGRSILGYSDEYSLQLMKIFMGHEKSLNGYGVSDISTIEEFGNILLGSCLSKICDVIDQQVNFLMPMVNIKLNNDPMEIKNGNELNSCILAKSTLSVGEITFSGHLIILLKFENIFKIISKIEEYYNNKLNE